MELVQLGQSDRIDGPRRSKTKSRTVLVMAIVLIGLSLSSCSSLFRTFSPYDVSAVSLEKRENGYLVHIAARRPLKNFEAWVNQDYWLYMTIAEASVDLEGLQQLKPGGLVEQVDLALFEDSVQIAIKLSKRIRFREIIHDAKSDDIFVALHLVEE
ncbi:MAG TPA: hypothetical protein VIH68_05670 [Bacteroidota bacterium]